MKKYIGRISSCYNLQVSLFKQKISVQSILWNYDFWTIWPMVLKKIISTGLAWGSCYARKKNSSDANHVLGELPMHCLEDFLWTRKIWITKLQKFINLLHSLILLNTTYHWGRHSFSTAIRAICIKLKTL